MTYLLDTNTVGYLVRNQPTVLAHLVSHPPALIHISAITEGELLFGLANNPSATRLHRAVSEFIRRTTVVSWDRGVALNYGFLRAEMNKQGKPLAPLDMLIAAHARSIKAILVSSDAAFQMVPGLQVEDWMIPA
jgi:tRNA(fMet)-specific endonuclease VapC